MGVERGRRPTAMVGANGLVVAMWEPCRAGQRGQERQTIHGATLQP